MFDLPRYGDGICLARMAELLEVLKIDRTRLQQNAVVITGSNGKGSTAAFCAAIGHAYGLRTGLFTSPHLYRFNERFQIDGQSIADDDLTQLSKRIETAIAEISKRRGEKFGAFEAMFALACLYFQNRHCDFTVFEAGIGGRYDPVRLIGARLTCVTSVDYEHTDLLGKSLELIVSDKSDACAADGTVIYGENCRPLRSHLLEYNRNRNVTSLFVRDQVKIADESTSSSGQAFDLTFENHTFHSLETVLHGAFQFNNAAIATGLFLTWTHQNRPQDDSARIEAAVRSGLRATRWPGRLEIVAHDPLTVVDVGHTPDAIRQSLASLKNIHGADNWILVIGVSFDKKLDEIAAVLAPSFETIVCTHAHHKGADVFRLTAAVKKANPAARVHFAELIEQSVELSRLLAEHQQQRIYVAGGLFVAIEYATVVTGGRVEDLKFF